LQCGPIVSIPSRGITGSVRPVVALGAAFRKRGRATRTRNGGSDRARDRELSSPAWDH